MQRGEARMLLRCPPDPTRAGPPPSYALRSAQSAKVGRIGVTLGAWGAESVGFCKTASGGGGEEAGVTRLF